MRGKIYTSLDDWNTDHAAINSELRCPISTESGYIMTSYLGDAAKWKHQSLDKWYIPENTTTSTILTGFEELPSYWYPAEE